MLHTLQVIQLHKRHLLLPERYPRFTLLGQALGSVRLGHEALTNAVPQVQPLPTLLESLPSEFCSTSPKPKFCRSVQGGKADRPCLGAGTAATHLP